MNIGLINTQWAFRNYILIITKKEAIRFKTIFHVILLKFIN